MGFVSSGASHDIPEMIKTDRARVRIEFPENTQLAPVAIGDLLARRTSERNYSREPLSVVELGTLLQCAYGLRKRIRAYGRTDFPVRMAPSSGGLQTVDIQLIVNNIAGVEKGLYRYNPVDCSVEQLSFGYLRSRAIDLCFGQEWVGTASIVLFLICDLKKLYWKYGPRCYRMAHLDAGVVAQNIHLVATAMDLGSCMIAGFTDETTNDFLELDGTEEFVALIVTVGKAVDSAIAAPDQTRS